VLIVASYLLVWVSQSEYAQILLTGEGAAEGGQYNKPGFVCYLNHAVLVFYFPIIYVILLVTRGPGSFTAFIMSWCGNFSMSKALKEVTLIAAVYWVCIWTWVVGLTYISVSASNALYQLQCVFTVVFSVIFLNESLTSNRQLGCIIAFVGIATVVLPPFFMTPASDAGDDDPSNPQNSEGATLKGTMFTLASAVLWGAYEVGYMYFSDRKNHETPITSPSASKIDTVLETMTTLSFIGVGTAVSCIPFLAILDFTSYETFALPNSAQIASVCINAALSFTFDLLFALAIFMTSPVVVSISAALVIPLSFVADYFLHGTAVNMVSVGGSVVVLAGLYVLNSDDFLDGLKRTVSGVWRSKLDTIPGTPETSMERSGSGSGSGESSGGATRESKMSHVV